MDSSFLKKFREGRCSKEEARQVLAWLSTVEAEIYFSNQADLSWNDYKLTNLPSELKNQEFEKLAHRLNLNQAKKEQRKVSVKSRRLLPVFLKAAAAITLIVMAWFGVQQFDYREHVVAGQTKPSGWIEKRANPGQKLTIYLNDGSKVMLNAGTTLKYNSKYGDSSRNIFLQGEAFFEVVKDSVRPFTVHTGNFSTTALGTSFNVRAYENEPKIEVALVTGKVKVEHTEATDSGAILEMGDGIRFDKQDLNLSRYRFDPLVATGWKDGVIYFKEAGNQEIFDKLALWYGVEFQVERQPDTWVYTGEFRDMSLEEVLSGLSYVKDFEFQLKNGLVIIR
jgi:ferric-dicitrate binding protein FerR (iron transport regulator)